MVHNTRTEKSRDDWETPPYFFELVDEKYKFTVDIASDDENCLVPKHYTKKTDGLKQDLEGEVAFCNPPYKNKGPWLKKCYKEGQKPNTIVVALIPDAMDTQKFHEYCLRAYKIYTVKGRIQFLINGERPFTINDKGKKAYNGNNLGSLLIVFKMHNRRFPKLRPFYHLEKDLIRWCACGDEILIDGKICENCKFIAEEFNKEEIIKIEIELPEAIENFMKYKKILAAHKIRPLEFEAFCQEQNYIVLKECIFESNNCVLKWLGTDCKTCEARKTVKGDKDHIRIEVSEDE